MKIKDKVLEYLENNKEKWILGKEICNVYNLEAVQLRHIIQVLRFEKHLIIASSKGYMLTGNKDLINNYINARRNELKKEAININCLVNALRS